MPRRLQIENHLDRQRGVKVLRAILRVDRHSTIDGVVFAEPGDLTLLGARTPEGSSLVVDARRRQLVAAGPLLAA